MGFHRGSSRTAFSKAWLYLLLYISDIYITWLQTFYTTCKVTPNTLFAGSITWPAPLERYQPLS